MIRLQKPVVRNIYFRLGSNHDFFVFISVLFLREMSKRVVGKRKKK